jgi:hypothetical protein
MIFDTYDSIENKLSQDEVKQKCMFADASFFDRTLSKVTDQPCSPAIEAFLHHIKDTWNSNINLYLHNCQHFSKFVRRAASERFILFDS